MFIQKKKNGISCKKVDLFQCAWLSKAMHGFLFRLRPNVICRQMHVKGFNIRYVDQSLGTHFCAAVSALLNEGEKKYPLRKVEAVINYKVETNARVSSVFTLCLIGIIM